MNEEALRRRHLRRQQLIQAAASPGATDSERLDLLAAEDEAANPRFKTEMCRNYKERVR